MSQLGDKSETCDQNEPFPPVHEMVSIRPTGTDIFLSSEPIDVIEESTSHDSVTTMKMPYQLFDHSYSCMEHAGLTATDQQPTLQTDKKHSLSWTSSGMPFPANDVECYG